MDLESIREMSPNNRPRWFIQPFMHTRAGPWVFMVLMSPVIVGAVAGCVNGNTILHIILAVVGSITAVKLSSALVLGSVSGKWGTYFRNSEPKRYWADVMFLAICYYLIIGYGLTV